MRIGYNLLGLSRTQRPRPGDSPSVPTSKSHRSQGRTSHVNQVNNLNLRRESLATAAERSNAYRNARCSVTWLVHTGAHSGSLELEETVRDLQRITGVAANKEWRLRRERRGQVRRPPVPTGTIAAERLRLHRVVRRRLFPSQTLPNDPGTTASSHRRGAQGRVHRVARYRRPRATHHGEVRVRAQGGPQRTPMRLSGFDIRAWYVYLILVRVPANRLTVLFLTDPVAHRVGEWIDAHCK